MARRAAVLLVAVALAAGASGAAWPPKPAETPGSFLAAGVVLFCRETVAPLDRRAFVLDLARELTRRVQRLSIRAVDGRPTLVDDLRPGAPLLLTHDLVGRPAELGAFADEVARGRPDVDATAAYRAALQAAARRVDPYASVEPLGQYDEQIERLDRHGVGIGVVWVPVPEGARVVEVVPRSPAARADLRAGDRIVAADGTVLAGMDGEAIHKLLGGVKGTSVRLTVRAEGGREREVALTREALVFPAVRAEAREGGVLLLRLGNFTRTAPREMRRALCRNLPPLARGGGVILDLRGNTGGYLVGAYDLANLFLARGPLFRGLAPDGGEALRATADRGTWDRAPLVVLVDGLTMSSSEVLAASLADADRALIVGDRTGGKGLAQREIDLPLGQALYVSVLRIETAAHRTIQGYGVWPHVEVVDRSGREPARSARQPYLWLDPAHDYPRPRLVVDAARFAGDKAAADDPALAVAEATLAAWRRDPARTLLDAARGAFPDAKGGDGD